MYKRGIYKGVWYLPDSPERRVQGDLIFNPKSKSKLEIFGSLEGGKRQFLEPENGEFYEIILGTLVNGNQLTLVNCIRSDYSSNYKVNLHTTSYNASIILDNCLLTDKSLQLFNKISFQINLFPQWMERNIVNFSLFYNENTLDGFQLGFSKSKNQEIIKFMLDNNNSIEFESFANFREQNYSGYSVFSSFSIVIISEKNKNLDFLTTRMKRFTSFINLCFTDHIFHTAAYINCNTKTVSEPTQHEHPWKPVYYVQKTYKKKIERSLHKKISYDDLKENAEVIFNKWMNLDERLDPIVKTLILLNEKDRNFTLNDFLNITQCIDGFYRITRNVEQSKFKKKLTDLISELTFLRNIGFSDDEINQIIDNRDHYTHIQLNKTIKKFSIQELYNKTRKLHRLLLLLLFKEVGFSNEMLVKFGQDSYTSF